MAEAFEFNPKQIEAKDQLSRSPCRFFMAFGGSRSGKTFLLIYIILVRALKAPGSRHGIFKFRLNSLEATIVAQTLPAVLRLCFPGLTLTSNKKLMCWSLPNGSELWFCGLDDKERLEKVLGHEFATVYFNECSQIGYPAQQIVLTRLAQKVMQVNGNPLRTLFLMDCNPPNKLHWCYKLFVQRVSPDDGRPLLHPEHYDSVLINPHDNRANLSADYLDNLENQSEAYKRRFLLGMWADANPNALFKEDWFDRWRTEQAELPDMQRVAVAVDPSGSGDEMNADNDAIGIMVVGLGVDGVAYVLEDCTVKAGPATWGSVAVQAYIRHEADVMVGEINYGGAMVEMVVRAAEKQHAARVNYVKVTASRGKVARAEPFSALYEVGKIRHVGRPIQLETELSGFSTIGYTGDRSPNRADALIWALAALFPAIVNPRQAKQAPITIPTVNLGWTG